MGKQYEEEMYTSSASKLILRIIKRNEMQGKEFCTFMLVRVKLTEKRGKCV